MDDYILLLDIDDKNFQDLLIFDKKLSSKEYEKIKNIVSYVRNYNGYCIDDIIEELKKDYSFQWIELTEGRIKTIEY